MPNRLTPRELEVLFLAANGKVDKEAATELGVTLGTIRTYWERINQKLGTMNRTHAVAILLTEMNPDEVRRRMQRARPRRHGEPQ